MSVREILKAKVTMCRRSVLTRLSQRLSSARHFPVVDGGRLLGIVSIGDVVKNRLEEVTLETKVLRDTHIAAPVARIGGIQSSGSRAAATARARHHCGARQRVRRASGAEVSPPGCSRRSAGSLP